VRSWYRKARTSSPSGPPPKPAAGTPPRAEIEARKRWCRQNGIDAQCYVHPPGGALTTFDVTISTVPESFWTAAGGRLTRQALASAVKYAYVSTDAFSALPATFAFRTARGNAGLLQIVGATKEPLQLKVRYKLLKRPKAGEPATRPAGAR